MTGGEAPRVQVQLLGQVLSPTNQFRTNQLSQIDSLAINQLNQFFPKQLACEWRIVNAIRPFPTHFVISVGE